MCGRGCWGSTEDPDMGPCHIYVFVAHSHIKGLRAFNLLVNMLFRKGSISVRPEHSFVAWYMYIFKHFFELSLSGSTASTALLGKCCV